MTFPQTPSGTIAGSVLPIRRAEELIATLPGVLSVRIVPSDTGAVDEIHVLTTDLVLPKNTVRNIESALMAQLGLRVNHRKISIATTLDAPRAADLPAATPAPAGLSAMDGGAAPAPAAAAAEFVASASAGGHMGGAVRADSPIAPIADAIPASRRVLIFEDVEVRRSRSRGVLCRVTLSRDGQEFVGECEGQESERSRIDLAARATLLAIIAASKAMAGSERSLVLEGAKQFDAFDRVFMFVSVSARVGREPVMLTGSCEVRESAETSAVLAVLDATNRWMHLDR
jgi:predicted hotdog family 3-hydroxylacyl-ACP dehydratase